MPVENNTLALTGLLFGSLTLILLFFPFALYIKELMGKDRDQSKSFIEIILYAFLLQFGLAIIISFITVVINITIIKPEMKPSYGVQYFYGEIYSPISWSGKTPVFWENWMAKEAVADTTSGDSGVNNESLNSLIIWYKVLSLIVFVIFSIIPLMVLTLFFIISFRTHQHEQHLMQRENGILIKITKGFGVYFGLVFVLYLHLLVASAATKIMGNMQDKQFSFYDILSTLWHSIIFGATS